VVKPRQRQAFLVVCVGAMLLLPVAAWAAQPDEVLERLMTQPLDPAWFTPAFLNQIPIAQVEALIVQLNQALGPFEKVVEGEPQYLIYLRDGIVPAEISLDPGGRIEGLFFHTPRLRATQLDELVASLQALPGQTALLITSDRGVLAAHNAEAPLAVGSAFKLAVLAALRDRVERGESSWEDVIPLPTEARSHPTGIMQAWPAGSPVTLHTLATLMISLSDNTATDALILFLGRESVEAYASRNIPLLTTRELFILKAPENAGMLRRYREAAPGERRRLLDEEVAALPLPPLTALPLDRVTAPDVDWFFSASELCSLMAQVEDLPFMSINPGIASPQQWQRVAYKGGSLPGVLALVSSLWDQQGNHYCVAAVWNDDAPLDEAAFYSIYAALLEGLAKGTI